MRALALLAAVVGILAGTAHAGDWLRFGYDAARSNASTASTGITAANVGKLVRQQVPLEGVADSSPVYARAVTVGGAAHDVFLVTTSYGRTYAIDADSGEVLWKYVPPGIDAWDHSAEITNSTPIVDPERRFVYAASPDGRIHKLALADGDEVTAGAWPAVVTLDAKQEKIGPALNISGNLMLATTGGYIGDIEPYQGHVVSIDRRDGHVVNVFNALCANRKRLMAPTSCEFWGAAIWGRGGAVVEPKTRNLLVATGNGPYDGMRNWGDSVLELSPDAGKLLQAWTPANAGDLEATDLDLGSTSPSILTPDLVVQGGKDGVLKLLRLDRLNGRTDRPGPIMGGALQTIRAPRGRQVLASQAVWRTHGRVWLFVTSYSATGGYLLVAKPKPHLRRVWETANGGSSPVVADGLLYVFNPLGGSLNVYRPATGRRVAVLDAGLGHWNSPIVADGRIALPEGDANRHRANGVLDIYRLPRQS